MQSLAGIDATLSRAAETKEVPGVVAVAATRDGPAYAGAAGKRAQPTSQATAGARAIAAIVSRGRAR